MTWNFFPASWEIKKSFFPEDPRNVMWAMKNLGCLGCIGDEILPNLYGDFNSRQYKDPYKPTKISWKGSEGFFRSSLKLDLVTFRM